MTETNRPSESLADAYPKQQARVRAVLADYRALDGAPRVNVKPAIFMIEADLREADEAAMSGDVLRMMRAYECLTHIG